MRWSGATWPLEQSIALYERGAALKAHCATKLRDAEEKVELIRAAGGPGRRHDPGGGDVSFPDRAGGGRRLRSRLGSMPRWPARADQPVIHAMRYAVRGGKRLRGFLVLEGARMLGVAETQRGQRRGGDRGAARLFAGA